MALKVAVVAQFAIAEQSFELGDRLGITAAFILNRADHVPQSFDFAHAVSSWRWMLFANANATVVPNPSAAPASL
ncbi:MAG TPA: hypothetical protein VEB21_20255 [Terriglobales bacterium]|nr:hypothetical protein [Terriglobales bacterium]